MKALPVQELLEGDWLYEIKHDGYRALAFKDGKDVHLVSRNKKTFNYPQLLEALKSLPAYRVMLDGEIAALDEKGRSSFQLLQLFKSSGDVPLVYYAFDLLSLEGKHLRKEPLTARRKLLAQVLEKAPENIRLSGELRGTKDELLQVAQEFGLEGLVPKGQIHSTKAVGAVVPGLNSRSPNLRNSLSAVTRCLRGAGATLVLCWSATGVHTASRSPAESAPVFRKSS
jgi:ATP-dependent DNA ligase